MVKNIFKRFSVCLGALAVAINVLPVFAQRAAAPGVQAPPRAAGIQAAGSVDSAAMSGGETAGSDMLKCPVLQDDPSQGVEPAIPLQSDPNEPAEGTWQSPKQYWQPTYHPQVTSRVFRIISYPYYIGGTPYPLPDITKPEAKEAKESRDNGAAGSQTADPNEQADPNSSAPISVANDQDDSQRLVLEKCFDLIHRWRRINEAPGTALEIVRSIELTKTSTSIYRLAPRLAVQVKRVVGQIGRINRTFDATSRMAFQYILVNHPDQYTLVSRMEKSMADLHAMLGHLAEYNDQISTALGVGKIDRVHVTAEKIDYSNLAVPDDDPLNKILGT